MPEEAERYWQIFPPKAAENVVTMAQASCCKNACCRLGAMTTEEARGVVAFEP
jgi:hypothetical protein